MSSNVKVENEKHTQQYGQQYSRLSLILMLWEKVSENKRNWISLFEMKTYSKCTPILFLVQCSAWKSDYVKMNN